jgi:hypothetical protein
MINGLVIFVTCIIALYRPKVGFLLFLLLHSTIFNLGLRFGTIEIGFGYVGTADLLPVFIFLAVFFNKYRQNKFWLRSNSLLIRIILGSIAVYLAWNCIGLLQNIFSPTDTNRIKFALRYLISGVFYWFLLYLPLKYSGAKLSPKRVLIIIAAGTAIADLVIKIGNIRSLMLPAFFWGNPGEYAWIIEARLQEAVGGWFRVTAQGFGAIELVGVYLFTYFLYNHLPRRQSWYYLLGALVCIAVSVISVYRASIVATAGVFLLLILFSFLITFRFNFISRSSGMLRKFLKYFVISVAGVTLVATFSPSFVKSVTERIVYRFGGLGSEINFFNPSAGSRGWDNVASINTIRDHPIFGVGNPRYPDYYNLRPSYYMVPTDIMPLLKVGLVCGIPGIILALWVLMITTWYAAKIAILNQRMFSTFMPYCAVFMMALLKSLTGAGAFLDGISLVAYAIFLGSFLSDLHRLENIHAQKIALQDPGQIQLSKVQHR